MYIYIYVYMYILINLERTHYAHTYVYIYIYIYIYREREGACRSLNNYDKVSGEIWNNCDNKEPHRATQAIVQTSITSRTRTARTHKEGRPNLKGIPCSFFIWQPQRMRSREVHHGLL